MTHSVLHLTATCCSVLISQSKLLMQFWILIWRSGRAERYNATLCTLLLALPCRSGFTTRSMAANIWWFGSCHHGIAGLICHQSISWKWTVFRNLTCNIIQNLSTVLLCRMHLHRLFRPFTHSFTRTFLVSLYSDQNGYSQWASVSDNRMLSFLASCEDRNSFSFSNHVFEKIQDNGQCSNYSYVCNTLPSKTFRMMNILSIMNKKSLSNCKDVCVNLNMEMLKYNVIML